MNLADKDRSDSTSLYLVPTPIGNLEDMTYRGVRVLGEVDTILAEDTRVTGKLLKHYGIDGNMTAFHQYNEHQKLQGVVEPLKKGERIALVSDAGMPGISDPGFLLVRECRKQGLGVEVLPGPTALLPALVASGLPCERFCFEGFLPHKKGRKKRLDALKGEERTMVFYESPYRLTKTLAELKGRFGPDRRASVVRELSKLHEEVRGDTLGDLLTIYEQETVRGEIVLVVAGDR